MICLECEINVLNQTSSFLIEGTYIFMSSTVAAVAGGLVIMRVHCINPTTYLFI